MERPVLVAWAVGQVQLLLPLRVRRDVLVWLYHLSIVSVAKVDHGVPLLVMVQCDHVRLVWVFGSRAVVIQSFYQVLHCFVEEGGRVEKDELLMTVGSGGCRW